MIESINISSVATYGNSLEVLSGLSQFNFIYGSNGTGKTTISRIIADESKFPSCSIIWKHGTKLQPLVYNHDFIDRNFVQSSELKSVFTLGEQKIDTLAKIKATKDEVDVLTKKVEYLTETLQGTDGLGGKKAETSALETGFKDQCWNKKVKYDTEFHVAFEGFRNNAEKFRNKVIQESGNNTSTLLTFEELQKKAASIFGPAPTPESPVTQIDATNLIAHETNHILATRVIGKDDVDIAGMIKKLGNSDWVRAGRSFYDANGRICPFCQQSTEDSFALCLNEYFDETYLSDNNAIDNLLSTYRADSERIQQVLLSIIAQPSRFLDVETLKIEKELLDSRITVNNQRLVTKKKEASQVVELDSLGNVTTAIKALISKANEQISEHNRIVSDLKNEKEALTAQVWRFVLEELSAELKSYRSNKENLGKAIAGIESQIAKHNEEMRIKITELRDLEKQTTSIQPTIDGINNLLNKFGFHSFKLAKTSNGTSYKLVRPDGADAKSTLSEGEKSFITFLYFYYLLKGSDSESGITTDRVVVFDDPVSSLDSEILFIVSSLIKGLFDEVRALTGQIKQIFILTHNVYFHKEITFSTNRRDVAMNEETFWVVRKLDKLSKIEKHGSNPIKTSYDLLWSEVRNTNRCNLSIQNTLRRILENYFKILGGIDSNKICDMFDGKDKLICKSLFSWVNDGSHYAHDDLYVSIDSSQVETFLKVFRTIFEKTEHAAHYKMMMGIENEDTACAVIAPAEEGRGKI